MFRIICSLWCGFASWVLLGVIGGIFWDGASPLDVAIAATIDLLVVSAVAFVFIPND